MPLPVQYCEVNYVRNYRITHSKLPEDHVSLAKRLRELNKVSVHLRQWVKGKSKFRYEKALGLIIFVLLCLAFTFYLFYYMCGKRLMLHWAPVSQRKHGRVVSRVPFGD